MPEISIILPCYNGSRYLAGSIESCLKQTFADFELVLVNDCSTDNTLQIMQDFAAKDQRIKVLNNPQNLRLPLSLNKGFDNAVGKYFTWTSDDNLYAPNALQVMYDEITKSNADLVYTDYTLIDEHGKVTGTRTFNDVNKSFHNWLGCGACFLYKAELHKKLKGYNPSFFLIEDYEFFVRAFINYSFKYIPRTDTYFYREHAASLTGTQGNWVNDVSKMAIERQMPELEKKLSPHEMLLLNRKYAVYHSVFKNNARVGGRYLKKVSALSKTQGLLTLSYIAAQKAKNAVAIPFQLFIQMFQKN